MAAASSAYLWARRAASGARASATTTYPDQLPALHLALSISPRESGFKRLYQIPARYSHMQSTMLYAIFRGLLRGVLLARPKVTTQGCRRVARSAAGLVRAKCQSPHRPPPAPALSPLAVGHLRSATRRLLQCQPPAGPSAHSLVQFLVARHAQTAQPNAATKTATSWPICAFASAIPGAETRRTAQPTTATKATSLFSRQN